MKSLREIFEDVKRKVKQLDELQLHNSRYDVDKMKEIASLRKLYPDMADALSIQWGHPEFYEFIQKLLDGKQIGNIKPIKFTPATVEKLGALVTLHIRTVEKDDSTAEQRIHNNGWAPEYEYHFSKGAQSK